MGRGTRRSIVGPPIQVISTLVGIVASVIATWVVAHIYYRRGTVDLQQMFDKLPDALVARLPALPNRKMTLDELEALIQEADAYPTEFGLFPNTCPRCGGKVEIRGDSGSEYSEPEAWPECPACGWRR